MALSSGLRPARVVGVDPSASAVAAAQVRAAGHSLDPTRVLFREICPDSPLPFPDDSFHLTTCISVLEFIPSLQARHELVAELRRVTRSDGFIFLATPSPFRLRDYHSRRLLGDFIRAENYPWANTPWQLRAMFRECTRLSISRFRVQRALRRLKLPAWMIPAALASVVEHLLPWQQTLFRNTRDVSSS
jgi:SAM-dependent methyltransferase